MEMHVVTKVSLRKALGEVRDTLARLSDHLEDLIDLIFGK